MQLDGSGITVEPGGDPVKRLGDPPALAFKDTDAPQHQVPLLWVCWASRFVSVKEMHNKKADEEGIRPSRTTEKAVLSPAALIITQGGNRLFTEDH